MGEFGPSSAADLPKLKKIAFRNRKSIDEPRLQFGRCTMLVFKSLPSLESIVFSALTAPKATLLQLEGIFLGLGGEQICQS